MPANCSRRLLAALTCTAGLAGVCTPIFASTEGHVARISTTERSFTIETERLRVTFENDMIVALKNLALSRVEGRGARVRQ